MSPLCSRNRSSYLTHFLPIRSTPNISQIFSFFVTILSNGLMRRPVRSSVPPEAVERGLDGIRVEFVKIHILLVLQIGHDGLRFLSRKQGKAATRMIVPSHRSVSAWINERRFADRLLIDPLPGGNLDNLVYKSICEMEYRIGGVQLVLEVGNHIGRKEISEASFGKETQCIVAAVKDQRVELRPIGDRDVRRD